MYIFITKIVEGEGAFPYSPLATLSAIVANNNAYGIVPAERYDAAIFTDFINKFTKALEAINKLENFLINQRFNSDDVKTHYSALVFLDQATADTWFIEGDAAGLIESRIAYGNLTGLTSQTRKIASDTVPANLSEIEALFNSATVVG